MNAGYYHFTPFYKYKLLIVGILHARAWLRLPKYWGKGVKCMSEREMVKGVKVYRRDRNNRPCYDSTRAHEVRHCHVHNSTFCECVRG